MQHTQYVQKRNKVSLQEKDNKILLWISKDYYICKNIELLESPFGTNESIADVVNDISEGFYPNVVALWYSVDDKKITLAFANRKEKGGDQ